MGPWLDIDAIALGFLIVFGLVTFLAGLVTGCRLAAGVELRRQRELLERRRRYAAAAEAERYATYTSEVRRGSHRRAG